MPLSRTTLERQLKQAESTLADRAAKLGGDAAKLKSDPAWRKWNADCSALRRRLRAVEAVEANNAELLQRKADKEAGVTADAE
jgi:hypothetical protein